MAMSLVLKAAPQSLVKSCRRLSQAVVIPPHPIKPAVQAEVTTCILVIPSNQPTLPQDSSNAQLGVPCSIPGIPSPILRSGYHVSVSHPTPPYMYNMYHPTVYTINHTLPCAALASLPTQCKNPCSGCANAGCKLSHEWREFPRFARKLEAI